jgi:hypothetical protein
VLAFLTSKLGLGLIAAALIAGVIATQTLRLNHTKSDLSAARASLAASESRLKASESLRASEYAVATKAASEAETACSLRVAQALKTSVRIRTIVQKPVNLDATNCPLRPIVPAGELRDALQP